MGIESIDLSLSNIYKSWFVYRKGKEPSAELDRFQYNLEREFKNLYDDLNNKTYTHGAYKKFIVKDNKTREIFAASVRDRVVHRLVYDYLTEIYDKTFIFDAWSCRKEKGLLAAVERTQKFMKKYKNGFVWRADIRKFFDNIDHKILLKILSFKIQDKKSLFLFKQIIQSFHSKDGKGISIGNLTSQIFSNIYLNELDRFVKYSLRCKAYLRYGDDFIIFGNNRKILNGVKGNVTKFIENNLKLKLHPNNNLVIKVKYGLKFLGVILYPGGRILNKRNLFRIKNRINIRNSGSYWGVVSKHGNAKKLKEFQWNLLHSIP